MPDRDATPAHADRLAELEGRHDDLIERLGDLNQQIEAALARIAPGGHATSAPSGQTCR